MNIEPVVQHDSIIGVYIESVPEPRRCIVTGDPIPIDDHAVVFRTTGGRQIVAAWLSIDGLSQLEAACAADDYTQHNLGNAVAYTEFDERGLPCPICGKEIRDGDNGFLIKRTATIGSASIGLHDGCRHTLLDIFAAVWEHAEILLPESL